MTFYVTKHALTRGIIKVKGNVSDDMPHILVADSPYHTSWHDYFSVEGKDWHRTIEAAQARAEELRARKIESLKLQLKNLEAKIF